VANSIKLNIGLQIKVEKSLFQVTQILNTHLNDLPKEFAKKDN
jgi:hypothetical protein